MTVIAWDGKTLAADRRACYGDMICTVRKIHRVGDLLVGGGGDMSLILLMVEWVRGGREPDKFPKSQESKDDWQPLLVIEADGTPSLYERSPYPIRFEHGHVAIGSGREFARAAMHLGKSAYEAVQVAIDLSPGCGNGIDTLER
jgi:20S proteasome alpha/beta subunit